MFKVTYLRQFVLQPKDNTWEERERNFQSEVEAQFFASNLVSDEMIVYGCVKITEWTRRKYENYYLKDSPVPLMSGIQLPKDSDGTVRNVDFIDCHFHANCNRIEFENCTFVNCTGAHG